MERTCSSPYPRTQANDTVTVTYSGLPGNKWDEIWLSLTTDSESSYRYELLTNQQHDGTATFRVTSRGTYEARAILNGHTSQITRSAPFTVN